MLQRLGLLRCADVRIGSAMSKGISGGQAKRTNIALALVTNPKVMFLGEAARRRRAVPYSAVQLIHWLGAETLSGCVAVAATA